MSRTSPSTYLEDTVALLVEHFGAARVRSALAKVADGALPDSLPAEAGAPSKRRGDQHKPGVTETLDQLRSTEPRKYELLTGFHARLKDKVVLPEPHDIRHFAHRVGLKDIEGKSRRDMIPKLLQALLQRSIDRLESDIDVAANISEEQRNRGYSILTDRILSGTAGNEDSR